MGIVIKKGVPIPEQHHLIFYCTPDEILQATATPLNVTLSKKLITLPPRQRSLRLESCLREILCGLPDDGIIRDFDVLFHPDYQVDILRLLVTVRKRKPFRAIWPGRYKNGRLCYAEKGFQDYKTFSVSDYDITCVV